MAAGGVGAIAAVKVARRVVADGVADTITLPARRAAGRRVAWVVAADVVVAVVIVAAVVVAAIVAAVVVAAIVAAVVVAAIVPAVVVAAIVAATARGRWHVRVEADLPAGHDARAVGDPRDGSEDAVAARPLSARVGDGRLHVLGGRARRV